jgi:hypothetical protein
MVSNQKQDIEDGRERAKNLCLLAAHRKRPHRKTPPHTRPAEKIANFFASSVSTVGLVLSDHAFRFEETTFSPMGGFVRSSQKNASPGAEKEARMASQEDAKCKISSPFHCERCQARICGHAHTLPVMNQRPDLDQRRREEGREGVVRGKDDRIYVQMRFIMTQTRRSFAARLCVLRDGQGCVREHATR